MEEYAVYQAALGHYRGMLQAKTSSDLYLLSPDLGQRPWLEVAEVGMDLLVSFWENNRTASRLDSSLLGRVGLSAREYAEIFQRLDLETDWKEFYRRYPQSHGIVTLSRPGFDVAGTRALLTVVQSRGSRNAVGELLLLEKSDAGWTVKQTTCRWIS